MNENFQQSDCKSFSQSLCQNRNSGSAAPISYFSKQVYVQINDVSVTCSDAIAWLRANAASIFPTLSEGNGASYLMNAGSVDFYRGYIIGSLTDGEFPPFNTTNPGSGWCDPGAYAGGGIIAAWITERKLPLFAQLFNYANGFVQFSGSPSIYPSGGTFLGNIPFLPTGPNVTITIPIPDYDVSFTFHNSGLIYDGLANYALTN